MCLRYGWKPNNTPQTCNCGAQFKVNHAMICHMGGFPTIRHNEIRDITASLLTEVCNNVTTEPPLQPLSGENMTARSANTNDGARVDIRARGFWNVSQDAFFDVRVLPKRILKSFNRLLLRLQETRTSQKVGIWTASQGSRAWCIHPSCFLYNWWYGKGGNNLLQAPCRHDSTEKATPIPSCDGLAEVSTQSLLCFTQSIHYVHSRQQIIFPPSSLWVRHHSGNI